MPHCSIAVNRKQVLLKKTLFYEKYPEKKLEYYTTAWYLNRKTRVFEKTITPAQNLSKWIFFFLT